jgi:hypothetical protein
MKLWLETGLQFIVVLFCTLGSMPAGGFVAERIGIAAGRDFHPWALVSSCFLLICAFVACYLITFSWKRFAALLTALEVCVILLIWIFAGTIIGGSFFCWWFGWISIFIAPPWIIGFGLAKVIRKCV